jgi:DNA-binding Lrp family transcriptional regulator
MFSSRNYLYVGAFLKDIRQLDNYSTFISQKATMKSPIIGFLSGVHSSSQIPYIIPQEIPVKISNLDKAIIRSLNKDSRKPISEVAEEVRSTPNTVSRRLERMFEEGILELSINFYPEASSDVFVVFQITIDPSANRDELAKEIMKKFSPHIFFIWTFSNLPNFMHCWVWCNNMKQLNDIIKDLRKEKIEKITSDIVHKAAFFDTWKEELLYD